MVADNATAQNGRKANAYRRQPFLFDGLAEDLAPGKNKFFDLSSLPDEKFGLVAHLAYFRLRITLTFAAVAADMTAAVQGYALLDFIDNIVLKVANHEHISGAEASLVTDMLYTGRDVRYIGRSQELTPALIADADATGLSKSFDILIPLANGKATERGMYDWCIPTSAFNRGAAGTCQFSLQVQRTVPETCPGITCTGTTAASLEVGLVYLDYFNQPPQWEIGESRDSHKIKTLESRGSWNNLFIYNKRDPSVAGTHAAYAIKQITLGQTPLLEQPYTGAMLLDSEAVWHLDDQDPLAALAFRNACPFVPIFMGNPDDNRISKMPAGPVRIEITTRPATFNDDRLIYLDTGIRTPEYDRLFRTEIGAPIDGEGVIVEVGAAERGGGNLEAFLPAKLYWPGAPQQIVRDKAAKKAAERAAGTSS
jgi:hypothetical protein